MTTPLTKELYPEYATVLKTAHDWQEYIKRYKLRNGSRLSDTIAVPTKDFLDLVNNFKQVSKSNRSRRKHLISFLTKAHPKIYPAHLENPHTHFLSWVTANRPNEYNRLLKEYYDFCKDSPSAK